MVRLVLDTLSVAFFPTGYLTTRSKVAAAVTKISLFLGMCIMFLFQIHHLLSIYLVCILLGLYYYLFVGNHENSPTDTPNPPNEWQT